MKYPKLSHQIAVTIIIIHNIIIIISYTEKSEGLVTVKTTKRTGYNWSEEWVTQQSYYYVEGKDLPLYRRAQILYSTCRSHNQIQWL